MFSILRQRNFALLWTAGLISLIGEWALYSAKPIFVLDRTGSAFGAGMVWAAIALPGIVVGPFAGGYVDRWDRRRAQPRTKLLPGSAEFNCAAVYSNQTSQAGLLRRQPWTRTVTIRTEPLSEASPLAESPRLDISALPVSIRDIWAAKLRISPLIWRTSLLPTATLSRMTGTNLRIKTENLQRTCSFKFRGALNAVLQLTPEQRVRGVCTFSAGNHGQGLAYAAQLSNVHCTVFMARDANPQKIEAIRGYGADVVFGETIGDASDRMEIFQQETGANYVSPYGDPAVIAGQGTIGLELLEDFPELEYVVVGIGGGGLASGLALAVKSIRPDIKVIGVEPEGAPTLTRSLEEGRPVRLESIKTIADGLGAPYALPIPFEVIRTLLDDVVLVDEDALAEAVRLLLFRCKLLVEPAGAASVAALLTRKCVVPEGANTVAILSGGNIDTGKLKALL